MKKLLVVILLGWSVVSCGGSDDGNEANSNCENPTALSTEIDVNGGVSKVTLSWSHSGAATFILEYGNEGFSTGSGTQITSENTLEILFQLTHSTEYDYYVKAICDSGSESNYAGPKSFSTLSCDKVQEVSYQLPLQTSSQITWQITNTDDGYQLEYGPTGFTPGTGTTIEAPSNLLNVSGLDIGTTYDVYVRTVCGSDYSEYSDVITFTTDELCPTPFNVRAATYNDDSATLEWNVEFGDMFEIEYGELGFVLGTGTKIPVSEQFHILNGVLMPNTTYAFYVRNNCGSDGFSGYSDPLILTTED